LTSNQEFKKAQSLGDEMQESNSKRPKTEASEKDVLDERDEQPHAGEKRADSEAAEIEQLKAELEKVKNEAADEHDRLLRLSAEFENYKKRMDRQADEFKKYANESLLKELLTVVDNLERAISSTSADSRNENEACVVEGVEMTLNEILKILKKFDVRPIEAKGKPFDPVYHEAMMQEETDEYPENTVINELQKGYMIHDRLLRPAMVVVSKPTSTT
jgi:molecular chaperone GrpE